MHSERENVALVNEESGAKVLWILNGDVVTQEIAVTPGNYPMFKIDDDKNLSVKDLVVHINKNLVGWLAVKMNIEGVNLDENNRVVVPKKKAPAKKKAKKKEK